MLLTAHGQKDHGVRHLINLKPIQIQMIQMFSKESSRTARIRGTRRVYKIKCIDLYLYASGKGRQTTRKVALFNPKSIPF